MVDGQHRVMLFKDNVELDPFTGARREVRRFTSKEYVGWDTPGTVAAGSMHACKQCVFIHTHEGVRQRAADGMSMIRVRDVQVSVPFALGASACELRWC